MYDSSTRRRALRLLASGLTLTQTSRQLGISISTLREWRDHPERLPARAATCPRCEEIPTMPEPPGAYAYLLGLYLGDGCISVVGDPGKRVWSLRIMCADSWPGLRDECARAMTAIRPLNRVRILQKQGCSEVNSYSMHWPHLFPQHGPGKKHQRAIVLAGWQEEIVAEHPGLFARGLIHSDGYRGTNRVRRPVGGEDKWYEYPRYLFKNESADILRLCGETLDRLGVAWRHNKPNEISVARRDAVARLDQFVGPKY
ncbi:helix-turn-helix domain-containing protein [Microbispora sp. H10885]|uniref:helix-turn-helix domain-containing protein n=1 Tax=Microbispora sp. H10885 TaxID=2729110 RepID=UPI0016037AC1|nr:helix-turn-helix domain-containing protein [Microbispora sp. H10885]